MEKMKEILLKEEFKPFKEGEIVEGKIVAKGHHILYIDLGKRTGVIYGREFLEAKDEIKNLKIGDKVLAKIVDLDNEEGFVELSLKGAKKEILLKEFEEKKEKGEILKVKFKRWNRGGLLTKVSGIPAFLPISQLSNPVESPEELKKFLGKEMEVIILSLLSSGQLILSEKLAKEGKKVEKLKVGEEVEGEISGVTDYGVFLKFKETEGLVPKKEIPENLNLKIGEKIKAKVIEISEGKILLTLKK